MEILNNIRVTVNGGVVTDVSRSVILQPEIKWNGKGIKWFDDSLLIRETKNKCPEKHD